MNTLKLMAASGLAAVALAAHVPDVAAGSAKSKASAPAHSTVGAGGYDLVSYQSGEGPVRGTGHHVAVQDGVTYLFASESNKKAFEASPEKYLPAYGGYCAYGIAVGKKFVGNPDVWEVVDGRLYLNLDPKIQGLWREDVSGHIQKADGTWRTIRDKDPSDL